MVFCSWEKPDCDRISCVRFSFDNPRLYSCASLLNPCDFWQIRDFANAFMPVGLPASYPVSAYGLAEHTAACSMRPSNGEGRNIDTLSDEALEACGDTSYPVKLANVRYARQYRNARLQREKMPASQPSVESITHDRGCHCYALQSLI